ncbi:pyruvate dehydrogenase (quinone) [Agromyces flavus]|uniref:Pyruvate dehydrogenase (Quinone) n=2 Tax=Agromyces flavus TaxID=589382 RepID=A0A1H1XSI5_9MICO|nr:thiamine pyrophosphate-requiring protein [Agromyces flavus]MCP2366500.1 pyruvate dehydrogenase (quinone) [Agromyces flavus]GGI44800.1 thiamine pyrophosphate-requiring protein [Agromyces flavus]SDT12180.1 pyruvate dehydrogenase (quinone) [Agromyces flavus]
MTPATNDPNEQDSQDPTVADAIVARLVEWGVDRIFGYSGDGINGVMQALRRSDDAPEFVQARHEETAAFMAVAHAKYTGRVGVVAATQGPGAIHLLNGLYDAKLDGAPVVAIVGQQVRSVLGTEYQQEVDLHRLFADVAAQYSTTVVAPEQVPAAIDQAVRTALATRSPTVVIVPHDVQNEPAAEPASEHGHITTAVGYRSPRVLPDPGELERAAAVLAEAERPVMLIGQGAQRAIDDLIALAERIGAAVVTSLLGKPLVDESLPFAAGTMGHLGTTASARVMAECDTLLIVGSSDPWTEFYPAPGQARAVQVDLDGRAIGRRYPVEVGLVGDARETVRQLAVRLPLTKTDGWRDRVAEHVREWRRIADARAETSADPVNPEFAVRALNDHLPDDALVALDVGSVVYWYARQLRLPQNADAHLCSTLASMGCGIPYGIAAKLAFPGRPAVVLAGDGGMQMTGIAELVTVADRWESWDDPRFVVLVLDNGDLAEVSWEQREVEGEPRFETSQALPGFPYARYAELLGLRGEIVDSPSDVGGAWRRAFAADRPTVIQLLSDRDVPLLPPLPQAREARETMRAGLEAEGAEHALSLYDEYLRIEGDV